MDRDLDCVKLTTEIEDRLDAICARFGPYAQGWDKDKLKFSLVAIRNWALLRDKRLISPEKGRKIATSAKQLLNSLDGVYGFDDDFMRTLRTLEAWPLGAPDWQGHGGDRRSGERTPDNQALEAIIQLYNQANAKPGFSKSGPLKRFVGDVCALLGIEPKSADAIHGEHSRLRRKTTSVEKS